MVLSAFSFGFGGHIADREIDDQGQKPYVCIYTPVDPKTMNNEGLKPPIYWL